MRKTKLLVKILLLQLKRLKQRLELKRINLQTKGRANYMPFFNEKAMIYQETKAINAVSVDLAKEHLRIDHDLENDLINMYINTATTEAEHLLQREIIKRKDDLAVCEAVESVPSCIQQYVLVRVGDLYFKRENLSDKALTSFYTHLLDPFIIYYRNE